MFNGNIVKNSAEATQSTRALITDYGITLDETSCLCLVPPESILGTTPLYFAWYANGTLNYKNALVKMCPLI